MHAGARERGEFLHLNVAAAAATFYSYLSRQPNPSLSRVCIYRAKRVTNTDQKTRLAAIHPFFSKQHFFSLPHLTLARLDVN
jgi:hypothetical protein